METEVLHFSVDGEWLTEFARSWFWDEDKPYPVVRELIGSCMVGYSEDEITKTVNDILEGRKKFVGVNTFELVDDNARYRPITDKLQEVSKKHEIAKIQADIQRNGIYYVDKWSTVKSYRKAREMNVHTAEECSIWFQYSDKDQDKVRLGEYIEPLPAAQDPTKAGLWLLEDPELIYICSNQCRIPVTDDEFWENIYEATKSSPGFEMRNAKYRLSADREIQVETREPEKFSKRNNARCEFGLEPVIDNSIPGWTGIIAPNGDFYPCDFAGHEELAYRILCYKSQEEGLKPVMAFSNGEKTWGGEYGKALDTLVDMGYVANHYLYGTGYYLSYKSKFDVNDRWKPTSMQKSVVWTAAMLHEVPSEAIPEIFY